MNSYPRAKLIYSSKLYHNIFDLSIDFTNFFAFMIFICSTNNNEKYISKNGNTNLVNGAKRPDGTVKALTVKQVADLLGHSTTQVTEMYYVKKDTSMLDGITNDFCL